MPGIFPPGVSVLNTVECGLKCACCGWENVDLPLLQPLPMAVGRATTYRWLLDPSSRLTAPAPGLHVGLTVAGGLVKATHKHIGQRMQILSSIDTQSFISIEMHLGKILVELLQVILQLCTCSLLKLKELIIYTAKKHLQLNIYLNSLATA